MKIAIALGSAEVGGSETNALRTARCLQSLGHEVHCVCLAPGGRVLDEFRSAGIQVLDLPLGSLASYQAAKASRRLHDWLRQMRIDVLHAYDPYSNTFAVPVGRLARTPLVIASQRWWREPPGRALQIGTSASFHIAHQVLVNSEPIRAKLISRGIAARRIWTIPNLLEDDFFIEPSPNEIRGWRAGFSLQDDILQVGVIARLTPVKDHATFLQAARLLRESGIAARFVLIGDGELRRDLVELSNALGLSSYVTFTGTVRTSYNPNYLLDIAVLPSLAEGFPNSVVEAMAAGRPVVATAVGGTPEAIRHGETGLLIRPRNPHELADRLAEVILNRQLASSMGMLARRHALQHYSAPVVLEKLLELYELAGR